MTTERREALVAGTILVTATLVLLKMKGDKAEIPLTKLFDVRAVAPLARDLPENEDDFIVSAWDEVARNIQYQPYGSILIFGPEKVHCQRCLVPQQVVTRRSGNCVAKSILLTSILRNRLAADRVYMAVGTMAPDDGGHAWVIARRRDGIWYLLESTMPPSAWPWVPVAAAQNRYTSEAMVNDQRLVCYDPEVCVKVKVEAGQCPCRMEKILVHR